MSSNPNLSITSLSARVSLLPATPVEIRDGGAGIKIRWGIAESPFGNVLFAQSPRGITNLSFFDADEMEPAEPLMKDWANASLKREDEIAETSCREIFHGESNGEFRLHVRCTSFQLRVWQALLSIPMGSFSTYGEIAVRIGREGASRAVGNAVGANQISYLIPCHRVIRANGEPGGYRWGAERKREMLAAELTPR